MGGVPCHLMNSGQPRVGPCVELAQHSERAEEP
jgi:hypothetical protein